LLAVQAATQSPPVVQAVMAQARASAALAALVNSLVVQAVMVANKVQVVQAAEQTTLVAPAATQVAATTQVDLVVQLMLLAD
jgi:hypothetical protein